MEASEIADVLTSIFGGDRIFIARGVLVNEPEYIACTKDPCAFIKISSLGDRVRLQIHKYIGVDAQNNPHIRRPSTLDTALREIEEVIEWAAGQENDGD